MSTQKERYQGCLLGLAIGDAIGTTVEFQPRGSFTPVTDMVGGGVFRLKAGQWTDDTSMALCLAHSLLECQGFDPNDQMNKYQQWRVNGYMSSNGRCFDIGTTVSEALAHYAATHQSFAGSTHPLAAGNGSLMRLAPVVLFYHPDKQSVVHYAGESSRTTHGAQECIDACGYYASLLSAALDGQTKDQILSSDSYHAQTAKIAAIQKGSYRAKEEKEIRGTGYVVDSLEAALWCFNQSDSYAQAVLLAANLGDDADTTAAICGQLAGAFYGLQGIPSAWRERVYWSEEILSLADSFYQMNE